MSNQVALITGGATGIGNQSCRCSACCSATDCLHPRWSPDFNGTVLRPLASIGGHQQ